MATSGHSELTALLHGLGQIIEQVAEVQGTPGEEDVDEITTLDGTELPLIDPDTVIVGMSSIAFQMRSGQRVQLDLIPS